MVVLVGGSFFAARLVPKGIFVSGEWRFPAVPATVKHLQRVFPGIALEPEVADIIAVAPKPAAAVVPVSPATPPAEMVAAEPVRVRIPNLKTRPWKHQVMAWSFLLEVFSKNARAAMLAMEMGTGKSLVGVAAALNLDIDLILIVCPLRVVDVWPEQFRDHADAPVRVLTLGADAGTVKDKLEAADKAVRLAKTRRERLVLVINYESLWREPFELWALQQEWGLVILDESHKIKSHSGRASKYAAKLRFRAKYRICMTGTPLPHSHLDIYSQYLFLDPSIYGNSYHAFKKRFSKMGGFQGKVVVGLQHEEEFKRRMGLIAFRVSKDVLDLPPVQHINQYCTLGREAERVYRELERDLIADIGAGVITAANAMVKVTRLQQIAQGFAPVDVVAGNDPDQIIHTVQWIDDSKRKLLADVLEDIGQEPVVVFCRYRPDMDAVHEVASDLKVTSLELSGRRDELAEWKQGKAQVLAVQISAGGAGVDLTRARYALYYSTNYSLGDYDQSLSRTHRPKQTRNVIYLHLLVKGTIDEKILEALNTRADVIGHIVSSLRRSEK